MRYSRFISGGHKLSTLTVATVFLVATAASAITPMLLSQFARAASTQVQVLAEDFNAYDGNDANAPEHWMFTDIGRYTTSASSGDAPNSLQFHQSTSEAIVDIPLSGSQTASSLSFWIRNNGAGGSSDSRFLVHESTNGSAWTLLEQYDVKDVPSSSNGQTENLSLTPGTSYLKFSYNKDQGNLVFDDVSITANENVAPQLLAEEFAAVNTANYKGISVGFNAKHFGHVTDITVTMERADGSEVIKTSGPAVLNLINSPGWNSGNGKLTTPFFIQEKALTESEDKDGNGDLYWQPAPANWDESTMPTKVTIEVTDDNGTETVVNENFTQGHPSWPTYLSLLPQASETIVVNGDTAAGENQPGWLFGRDTNFATPFEFNADAASIGEGSLYVLPISDNPADKFIAENFLLSPIAHVNSISYDFKIGSGGDPSDANHFYMNVYANFGESDPGKFYDCRYDVVPAIGATDSFTTVTFNPSDTYPVTQSGSSPYDCPGAPADMDALSDGSTIRMFVLNVGDTSANDEGLDGYLDNVVINKASTITTYDFEPATEAPAQVQGLQIRKGHTPSGDLLGCDGYTNTRHIRVEWNHSPESDLDFYWFGTKFNEKHRKVAADRNFYHGNMTPGHNPYHYTVIAVNKAGDESPISEPCGLTLDTEAPLAEILTPADGSFVNGTVALKGQVTDENPINTHFQIEGPDGYKKTSTFKDGRALHELNWNTSGLQDGEYTIYFEARDKADNKDGSRSNPGKSVDVVTVYIDRSAPVISLENIIVSGDKKLSFDLTANDIGPAGLRHVAANIYDENNEVKLVDLGSGNPTRLNTPHSGLPFGTPSFDISLSDIDVSGLPSGTYTIRSFARDHAGNELRFELAQFSVDNTAPTVEITAPGNGDTISGTVDITGTVLDDVNLSHYNLSLYPGSTDLSDGGTHNSDRINSLVGWGSGTTNTPGTNVSVSRQLDTTLLADGEYQIRLAARDAAGNRDTSNYSTAGDSSVHVITVAVNNTPEAVPEPEPEEGEGGVVGGARTDTLSTTANSAQTLTADQGQDQGQNQTPGNAPASQGDETESGTLAANDNQNQGGQVQSDSDDNNGTIQDTVATTSNGFSWYWIPALLAFLGLILFAIKRKKHATEE